MKIFLAHTPAMRRNYYGEQAIAGLRGLGEVVLHDGDDPLDAASLSRAAAGCAVIVSDRNTPGPAHLFPMLPDTVAFVRCAVDIRTIDVAAASRDGILVTRASPGFVPAVAELAFGLMIALARGVVDVAAEYHAGRAPPARMGRQLAGSTLGLIGYGAIGRRVAALGAGFGMTVLVHDPHVGVDQAGLEPAPLDDLLARADFVVPLAVATPETENLIDAAALRRMKSTAFLVNLSRGDLVDEAALERALDQRWIAGAAMDVGRAPDQMPSPRLARRPDVIATPHIGGLTPPAIEHQSLETVAQVAEIIAGRAPRGAVNAEHAHRLKRLARA